MKKLFSILIFTIFQIPLFGQKIEVEKRIKKSEFPTVAETFIKEKFSEKKRIKYFKEINGDTIHYEAKFKSDGYCYSVEFFDNGQLEDIEKKIQENELPAATQKNINDYFARHYKKYKIKKIQEQTGHGTTRYEIEAKGKDQSGTYLYEFLFSETGLFIQRQKIILPSNNITLY